MLGQWQAGFREAVLHPVSVSLPYAERQSFSTGREATSYRIDLRQGERISVKVKATAAVLSELQNASAQAIATSDTLGSLTFTARETSHFTLIIQPGLETTGDILVQMEKGASLGFPVAGKGNSAIQSFWADVRDGGKRRHEGIDIFAKRGTPVVAVADGFVTYTGERGLGGKQVWQRLGLMGHSVYYAHLDGIAVGSGSRVKAGDTLGFVGNTGNAKGTPPHLHFGIYGSSGAVDPLPFVYQSNPMSATSFSMAAKSPSVKIGTNKANFRSSPNASASIIAQVPRDSRFKVLGRTSDWLHVRSSDGSRGFLHLSVTTAVN